MRETSDTPPVTDRPAGLLLRVEGLAVGVGAIVLYFLDGALAVGLVWLAHIGIDRALGYGLKYQAGFAFTHLGRIGKGAAG